MAKRENIIRAYEQAVEQLFSDKTTFADYLDFSGRFYKLPSSQTIMLYDDNPNAKMVADYGTWQQFGRRIKPGGWSTDVLENGEIKRLFDISMTKGDKVPYQWSLDKKTAEEFVERLSAAENEKFTGMSDCIYHLAVNAVRERFEDVKSSLDIPETDEAVFRKSFSSMVRRVIAARCEWHSDFTYGGTGAVKGVDLSALDLLDNSGDMETLLEEVQITAKNVLKSMEKSINDIIFERSIDNERNERVDRARSIGTGRGSSQILVRGGEEVPAVDNDAKRENVQAQRGDVRVRPDDGAFSDERGAGADGDPDKSLGQRMADVYDGELPRGYTETEGQTSVGADSAQDRQGGVGDYGANAGGIPDEEPAPDNGERDRVGGEPENIDAGTDNGELGERSEDDTVISEIGENNLTAEEQSPVVYLLSDRIANLSAEFAQKYVGEYIEFTLANYANANGGAEYNLTKSVRENVADMLNNGSSAFLEKYLKAISKEAYEGRIIIDEGVEAERVLTEIAKLNEPEQLRLFPEPLDKKQQAELEKLTASLTDEYARWEKVFLDGGSDTFYEDGISLELIRNHILYYKDMLKEKFPNDLPEIYQRETPPEYPNNYQSVKKGDTLRFEYGDFLVLSIEKANEYTGEYSVKLQDENGEVITQNLRDIKTKFRNLTNRGEVQSRTDIIQAAEIDRIDRTEKKMTTDELMADFIPYNEKKAITATRVGDFYEFYGETAKELSEKLNLTLTKRNGEPMVGVPAYKFDDYCSEWYDKGYIVTNWSHYQEVIQPRNEFLSPVTKITQVAIENTDDLQIQNAKNALVEYAEYLEQIRLYRSGAVLESEMFLSASVGVEITRNRAYFDREVQNAVNAAVSKGINGKLNIAETLSEARYGYKGEEIEGTSVEDFNALYKEMEENAEFAKALCAEISERLYEPYVRFVKRRQERQKEQRELAEELKQIAGTGKKSPFFQRLLKEAELLSPKTEAENFVTEETTPSSFGQKSRYAANIAAIKTLLRIEIENRAATPEEQKILAQYVGWGGIPQVFDSDNASWAAEYKELKELLTPDEYDAARSTVLTAHYTSPTIISAIYSALDNFGFKGGNVLEPAMGIGNFFGVMPDEMRSQSHLHGVELDDISGRIAKQLYPNADIQICGYENTAFSDNYFDVAFGNVPFGNYGVADTRYNRENFLIHDYFFAKTLDKVAPGGVVAFITSKGTLDKTSPKVREYLAKRADLIGAIRLPNDAFKATAGTEVTADIIFLQKREKMSVEKPDWCYTAEIAEGISVNQYFVDHPEMILGEMQLVSGRYGYETACVPIEGADLKEQLGAAVKRLNRDIITARREDKRNEEHGIIPATADVRNFTFTEVNDKIYFRENNIMREIPFSKRNHERMRGMIGIRNTFRELVDAQADGCTDETLTGLQSRLNSEYDAFVVNFGHISDIENRKLFAVDDDYNTLCGGLELIDPETKEVTKADVFTKRTIKPYVEVTHVDTPQEALFVSLDMRGFADIEYMAELCSTSNEEVIKELTENGFLYKNPETEKYEEAAEYLSGYVREKLREAQKAAEENPEYKRNVAALEKALPPKLGAGDISVRLGAPWVSIGDYCQFFREYAQGIISEGSYFGRDTVLYRSVSGEYKIENKTADKSVAALSSFGTKRMSSYAIFENLLNNRDIAVYDTFELPDGKKKRVMNKDETQLAQEKARQMKEAFPKWLWSDPERREKYVETYNELFNSLVGREYDGSHQTFPGMNPFIELNEHQKNAVMRAKLGGNTLLAHCVGAGKTFEMAAAIMEKRRLGLINKACVVVPKHLVGQMSAEWLRLYPEARLLTAKENDFSNDNRQKFIGRCCTGDYDAVIMSYQQFQKIPMSIEFQQEFLMEQIDNLTEQMHDFSGRYLSANDKRSVKDLERMKKNIETKLKKLLDTPHDNSLNFEQLGFDSIVVDEAHNYKNGLVVTKMKNVSGIGSKAAKKSEDFLMKTRYLNEKFGERNLILASGTPVSNSMTELYIMQQYLRPSALRRQGLQNFDDWASTFGEVVSQLELKPAGDGFRMKKRFAKFTNLPELMQAYKDFADIRTAEMLHLPVPEIEGGKPQVISAKPNEFQSAYMKVLAERSEAIHNGTVDPSVDNMLKITNEARLLGLDARCLNPDVDNYPNSKVNLLIAKVMEIYTETTAQKGVQAIFCDIAINDGKRDTGEIDVEIDDWSDDTEKTLSAEEQAELLAASKFSVYKYVKEELIRRGIPENEICFAGDAKNQGQRGELYAQLRAGTKRIVLASTTKMGTGANVQTRLCALHNLDIPWKPSDFEQRIGRIVRQGNTFPTVKIFNYVTEGTFDAYMLNLIVTKQRFISQLMSGKTPARTCEDVDELVLNYSEMQAIASGDPRIKEKIQLDTDVSRLRLLESEHLNQKYQLEDRVTFCQAQLSIAKKQLTLARGDKEFAEKNTLPEGEFKITVNGTLFTERKEAGAELRKAQMTFLSKKQATDIGEYRGFKMSLNWGLVSMEQYSVSVTLTQKSGKGLTYSTELELQNDLGNITRLENILKLGIDKRISGLEFDIARNEKDLAEALRTKDAPFEYADELAQKNLRLAQLDAELGVGKTDEIIIDDDENRDEERGKGRDNDAPEQNKKPKRPKR